MFGDTGAHTRLELGVDKTLLEWLDDSATSAPPLRNGRPHGNPTIRLSNPKASGRAHHLQSAEKIPTRARYRCRLIPTEYHQAIATTATMSNRQQARDMQVEFQARVSPATLIMPVTQRFTTKQHGSFKRSRHEGRHRRQRSRTPY